jgi:N-acetylmuramoyl-L-alanine amidase
MDKTNLLNNSCAKKRIFLTFFISIALLFSTTAYSQTGLGIKTVVIDAGHGGKDPGAVAKTKLQEKDVVLDVSLQLGKLISTSFPQVKVVYTRSTDVFIGLSKRAKIANDAGADLFISIHANAAGNTSAKGFESFVLGLHKSEAALEVAKWENSSILMEEDHEQKYESFDPNDPDAYIALSLRQNAFLDQSLKLAHLFQKNCVGDLKRPDRGVKQAGFLVLYKTTMPSVLVELGFLSNVEEEKFLASKTGRSSLAKELFDAFAVYKEQNDKVDGTLKSDLENQAKASNANKNDKVAYSEGNQSIVFRVQVATSKIKLELKPFNFKGMKDVDRIQSGNKYKYIVGNYSSIEMAKIRQAEVRKIGYESAFVIAFENGKRLDLQKAIEKSKI